MKSTDKNGKLACAGAGGSLGLAALAGACSAGCGLAAAPLAGVLGSLGLGAIASVLPQLRVPFILIAVALGVYSLLYFVRAKNAAGAAICGCVLGAGALFLGWQAMQSNDCKTAGTVEKTMERLSPHAKEVFQKGVYALWPELGRAPTIAEIRGKLGYESDEQVLSAFSELEALGFNGIFFPGEQKIKWFWPFSSLDHGVDVTLEGLQTVHARCAIDALGMSSMFGRAAMVSIKSALDGTSIELKIDQDKIVTGSTDAVVSSSDSCDDMLFFASRGEFDRYVKSTGKTYLQVFSLKDALVRGIKSFGKVLKV